MDLIGFIFLGVAIVGVVLVLMQHLGRISKHLRIIRLQLEIQNPMFVSEELLDLDKNITYWHGKMFKYKEDTSEKNKEISQLTFDLFWAYVERLNHYRIMIAEAKHTGDSSKIHDKYRDWLRKNEERIEKMEKRSMEIDSKIKDDLSKRNLDIEFSGKWDTDEN